MSIYIGDWHANLLRVERRKCVLFTNSDTLYSIFVFGLKRTDFDHLDEVFRQSLFRRLNIEGFSQVQIEKALDEYETIHFAKTNNRKNFSDILRLNLQSNRKSTEF